MKHKLFASLLSAAATSMIIASTALTMPSYAALPVFDPTNYAQNLLQAARALQQINQQIQQLQNQAQMITRMDKNLKALDYSAVPELSAALKKIDALMEQAQAISFSVAGLDAKFKSLFPTSIDGVIKSDKVLADAKARIDAAMAGFKHAMTVQAQVVENVTSDARTLADIISQSQGAAGSLQAAQATNQLLYLPYFQNMLPFLRTPQYLTAQNHYQIPFQ